MRFFTTRRTFRDVANFPSACAYETGFSFDVQQCCSKDFRLLSTVTSPSPLPASSFPFLSTLNRGCVFDSPWIFSYLWEIFVARMIFNVYDPWLDTKREKATRWYSRSNATRFQTSDSSNSSAVHFFEISLFCVWESFPFRHSTTSILSWNLHRNPLTKMIFTLDWTRSIGGETANSSTRLDNFSFARLSRRARTAQPASKKASSPLPLESTPSVFVC